MSVRPTSMIRSRRVATAGTIIASLTFAGVASADEPTVTQLDGNPTCSAIDPGYFEVKIDNVRQGRTVFGGDVLEGSIVVKGLFFDWSATPGVDAVVVKGGPAANVYQAGDEMTSGTGLHAPINPDNGRPYGLSHISFCSDGVDAPAAKAQGAETTGTPAGPCEPGGPATMPDGQPCEPAPTESDAPRGEVLGTTMRGGRTVTTAQMSGPGTCVDRSFVQVVRGKGIRRVTMFVNGRRIRAMRGTRSRYAVTIDPRRYPSGVMRVKARVRFVSASGRRTRTFRMTVLRCARTAVAPAFAG